MIEDGSKRMVVKIFRYTGFEAPHWDAFEIPVSRGMTVLDGLQWIKEQLDSTLAWRSSCRMGICGSCGMWINGKPQLACQTQLSEIKSPVRIKPLPNFDIIRDLVSDLSVMFAKHRDVKPWIIRRDARELENPTNEYLQTAGEMERYAQFSYCIKCGLCMSACPTLATDRHYLGPQPLAQALRYLSDSRDEGFDERTNSPIEAYGPWRCHFAGECSLVCPKHVDPALGIQVMKRHFFLQSFGLKQSGPGAPLAPPVTEAAPRPGIPPAPERTVK